MVPSYRARVEEDDGRIVGNAIRTDNEHEITHSTSRDESAQLREKIIERGRGPDAVFILRINRGRKKGGQFLLPFSSLSAQENSGNSVRVVVMEGGRKPLSRGLTDSCPLLSQSCPVERPTEAKRITARSPRIRGDSIQGSSLVNPWRRRRCGFSRRCLQDFKGGVCAAIAKPVVTRPVIDWPSLAPVICFAVCENRNY